MGEASYTIHQGGNNTGVPAQTGTFNSTLGYRFINTTLNTVENLIWLDVSTDDTIQVDAGKKLVVTLSTGTSPGTEIPLTGAGQPAAPNAPPPACNFGTVTCQGGAGGTLSAIYQRGSVLRVSFSVQALCGAGATGTLCSAGVPANFGSGATLSQSITVSFSAVNDGTTGTLGGTNSGTFTLAVSDIPPVISCPGSGNVVDYYFPGDGMVFLDPSRYGLTAGSSGSYAGFDVKSVVVLANRGSVNGFTGNFVPANEVIAYAKVNGGTQAIPGFVNTTNGTDNKYQVKLYAQNLAGIVSPLACEVTHPDFQFQSQPIQGVLNESKCFIATAAYQDGRAAPVMMLRRFRDTILAKREWGRRFIETYYRHSPAWAEWAWDKPLIRSLALRLLAPIELAAWLILKASQAEEVSPQPYIDSLKQELGLSGPAVAESYIESEKAKLEIPASSGDPEEYINRLKGEIGPGDSGAGYAESERVKLPEQKSGPGPIEMVLRGEDRLPEPERPAIHSALGFMVGVAPGIEVTNTGGALQYSDVYGGKWQPELLVHYERQLFHSETLGSFGLGVDGGLSFADGYGRLTYQFNGSTVSQTKFTFYQFPVLFSAYYRFNFLKFIRPYAGGSLGSIFYIEDRNDDVDTKRGYNFVYAAHAGVSILLDFFDSRTARDGYLSSGIQHSYLFAEYLYLDSFNQSGLVLSRSGIYTGFLFEI